MFDYSAFPQQRQEFIHQQLLKNGRVVCAELAIELNVSEHTIRRDLQELSQQGVCKKVYGGAVLHLLKGDAFGARKDIHYDEKKHIAQKCLELIQQECCIFIDASTTNLVLAQSLPVTMRGTIVTNSPEIAIALIKLEYCEVILLGGKIHRDTGGCIGATAIQQLQDIIFDQAFIGGCAMDPVAGLTGFNYVDSKFKKNVIRQSSQIIIPLIMDKIPRVARYVVAQSDEIDVIITQNKLDQELYQQFVNRGIDIYSMSDEQ